MLTQAKELQSVKAQKCQRTKCVWESALVIYKELFGFQDGRKGGAL